MKHLEILLALILLAVAGTTDAQNGLLTEWVEDNPFQENDKIGLGYPVPIPVDTPLPFDGFRTYAGLQARHMDLEATTPWVHGEQIGTTHAGRTIWAYRLGDEDKQTIYGLPEPATLTNGGIHAREWQTPETLTGIMELLAGHEEDNHFYDYLRDNVNMIVIPSLNIDGFLQTQRYPSLNYLNVDPRYPDSSPRDGRMRRKNMLNTDESLATQVDMLNGVDLNRNSAPFWATNPGRSSWDPMSLVYHGTNAASEPEIQALDAAAHLGPIEQLRLFTDIHSFTQVLYWSRNGNHRLAQQVENILGVFSAHQLAIPGGRFYGFNDRFNVSYSGFGMTNEYMYHTYGIPAFGVETEPTGNGGTDYGGTGENGHDGFILPESEIRRVREGLAQSFAAIYFRQAGPPSIQAMRFIDQQTGAVVYEAEWDVADESSRVLYENQIQPLQLGRDYRFWLAFNKPMRWRENGEVAPFPGQGPDGLDPDVNFLVGETQLSSTISAAGWINLPGDAPDGYLNYEDDTLFVDFSFPANELNTATINGNTEANVPILTGDMTGMLLDSNPATVAGWTDGHWSNYEDSNGVPRDIGGTDANISTLITDEILPDPFVLEPGISGAWYDLDHDGEGFLIEMLPNGLVFMVWFTYDDEGNQDWYFAIGEARGNRILFPELLQVSGGVFGPGFDPSLIIEEVVGSAKFTFSGCKVGAMDWRIGNRQGRQTLIRLTRLMGLDCGQPMLAPIPEEARFSGSWFDPTHNGEGFLVEVLANGQVVVYWFSYGPDGNRRWFFGVGEIIDGKLVVTDMLTTSGGIFGDDFDPATVESLPWGTLELDITCAGGTATYTSTEEGFGSGQLNVIQLTSMDGLECTP
jgi:hypothetical protein